MHNWRGSVVSAQVCSPGLAPAPTHSVTQAVTLGCLGPSPAQVGAHAPAPSTPLPLLTARLIRGRRPGSSAKSEGFRRQQAATCTHTARVGACTPGTPWMGEEVLACGLRSRPQVQHSRTTAWIWAEAERLGPTSTLCPCGFF